MRKITAILWIITGLIYFLGLIVSASAMAESPKMTFKSSNPIPGPDTKYVEFMKDIISDTVSHYKTSHHKTDYEQGFCDSLAIAAAQGLNREIALKQLTSEQADGIKDSLAHSSNITISKDMDLKEQILLKCGKK